MTFSSLQRKAEEINSQLNQEYTLRRSVLMKRLDVTVQSFGWSDRAKVCLTKKIFNPPSFYRVQESFKVSLENSVT